MAKGAATAGSQGGDAGGNAAQGFAKVLNDLGDLRFHEVSPRNMIFDEWGSSPAVGARRSVRTPVRHGVHGRRGAAEDSMATQEQFVHRKGAFLPICERLLTGVNECSREGRLAVTNAGWSIGSAASQFEPDTGKAIRKLAAVADTRCGLGGGRHPGTDCRDGQSGAPSGEGRDGAVFGEVGWAEGVVGV